MFLLNEEELIFEFNSNIGNNIKYQISSAKRRLYNLNPNPNNLTEEQKYIKKNESMLKKYLNDQLKVFHIYIYELYKKHPEDYEYLTHIDSKKAPTILYFEYDISSYVFTNLKYSIADSKKIYTDDMIFYQDEFVRFLNKDTSHSNIRSRFGFITEDYPGIYIYVKKY